MRQPVTMATLCGVVGIVALLSAACAPIPVNLPRPLTPTTSAFLPAVASGALISPLQPTAVLTSTVSVVSPATVEPALATPTATLLPTLVGPVWQWVSSTFQDGTVLAPGDPTRYTFQLLGDGNAVVQADCNFGTGAYEEAGSAFSFGAIGTTKMACPADSLDSAFLAQLKNTATYSLAADELVIALKDGAGSMRLRATPGEPLTEVTATTPPFASPTPLPVDTPLPTMPPLPSPTLPLLPVETPTPVLLGTPVPLPTLVEAAPVLPSLNGTSWFLVSLTAGNQAIPPLGSSAITLDIEGDGTRISGSTGCNLYRATLETDAVGATIRGPALMTRRACAAGLMVQEIEFIDSLLRMRSYVVSGNELTLLDGAANALLVFTRK